MMILPTSVEPVKESFRTNGCSAALFAQTGQHVEHAARQELLTDFSHQKDTERRSLGGLEHDRVAGA
jgi:hypothetical protein